MDWKQHSPDSNQPYSVGCRQHKWSTSAPYISFSKTMGILLTPILSLLLSHGIHFSVLQFARRTSLWEISRDQKKRRNFQWNFLTFESKSDSAPSIPGCSATFSTSCSMSGCMSRDSSRKGASQDYPGGLAEAGRGSTAGLMECHQVHQHLCSCSQSSGSVSVS